MRLHTITHERYAGVARHPSSVSPGRQAALRTQAPIRLHHAAVSGKLDEQLREWAKARTQAMVVDVERLDDSPETTDTGLAKPWRTVLVPRERLERLSHIDYPCAGSSTLLWGIGPERPVANCNPFDVNPRAIDFERSTSRPGKGPFRDIARGAYGNRKFKYLWAIDHRGMHIAREMTPCRLSSRGIITHSILVERGIVGGEMFFDRTDCGKVLINFGSARLPLQEIWQAEKAAEFVLALGYHTVIAMIPDRKLVDYPYGMGDRYGSKVQNVMFRIEEDL